MLYQRKLVFIKVNNVKRKISKVVKLIKLKIQDSKSTKGIIATRYS
jgi:hypothetical protein